MSRVAPAPDCRVKTTAKAIERPRRPRGPRLLFPIVPNLATVVRPRLARMDSARGHHAMQRGHAFPGNDARSFRLHFVGQRGPRLPCRRPGDKAAHLRPEPSAWSQDSEAVA